MAGDSRGWKLTEAREKIKNNNHESIVSKISYRPFDTQYIYYCPEMIDWGREKIMKHMLKGENVGLVFARQTTDSDWTGIQIVDSMVDNRFHFSYKGIPQEAPLYLYPDDDSLDSSRVPNLDMSIVKEIEKSLGLEFVAEPHPADKSAPLSRGEYSHLAIDDANSPSDMKRWQSQTDGVVLKNFTSIDILDYIYTALATVRSTKNF